MNWLYFPYFYFLTVFSWILVIILLFIPNKNKTVNKAAIGWLLVGLTGILVFTTLLWYVLQRPLLRTLGETRICYSVFISIIGLVIYIRWKYAWFVQDCLAMSILFLTINLLHPETYEKTLMPALQSYWFVPHVIVYLISYALLAASFAVALKGLWLYYQKKPVAESMILADNLVYAGFAFLVTGLVFGAMWAKEAWGDYWTWDPKETWSLLTFLAYLGYIHFRKQYHTIEYQGLALWILVLSFVILILCWFGINYLPTAIHSVHIYTG
jgi:ABC-type transport system involved in cytochrome c biogenesis permease subunit